MVQSLVVSSLCRYFEVTVYSYHHPHFVFFFIGFLLLSAISIPLLYSCLITMSTTNYLANDEHETAAERQLKLNNRIHQNFWLGAQVLQGFFANTDVNYETYYPGHLVTEGNKRSNGHDKKNPTISSWNRHKILSRLHLFDPQGPRILIWDAVCITFIIFTVLYMPIEVSFLANTPLSQPLEVVDYIVDAIFFADVCVTSNTAYHNSDKDTLIVDRVSIVTRYAKFWLWIDLAAAMPFDAIVAAAVTNNNQGQISFVRLIHPPNTLTPLLTLPSHTSHILSHSTGQIRAVRLVRILRLVRLGKLYKLAKFGWVKETLDKYNVSPAFVGFCVLVLQVTD